jgi:hypothetical protein
MTQTFVIEVEPGHSDKVLSAISPVLVDDPWFLPMYSEVLGTEDWVLDARDGTTSDMLRVDGVVTVEGTAEHVLYGLPAMREATLPGIGNLSADEIAAIVAPTPARQNISQDYPLGAPGLFSGGPANLQNFQEDLSWERTLDLIDVRSAWLRNRGEGAIIALVDSGVDGSRIAPGQLAGSWTDEPGGDPLVDDVGHGTMVAMIAASRPEINGFSGVAPGAKLYVLKPKVRANGVMNTGSAVKAMDHLMWVAKQTQSPVIMNNSWGLWGCKSLLLPCRLILTRVMEAMDHVGVCCPITVWAIGNNEMLGCSQGISSWCMNTAPVSVSVGAVDLSLNRQSYSSLFGQCYPLSPVVAAPTQGVLPWGSGFSDFGRQGGGTSATAPQVSGALAILATEFPELPNPELRAALRSGAQPIGPDSDYNPGTGSGLLQIGKALIAAPHARNHITHAYELDFRERFSTLR